MVGLLNPVLPTSLARLIPGEFYTAFDRCVVVRDEFDDLVSVPGFNARAFLPHAPFMSKKTAGVNCNGDDCDTASDLALCLCCLVVSSRVVDDVQHQLSRKSETFLRSVIQRVLSYDMNGCAWNQDLIRYIMSVLLSTPQLVDGCDKQRTLVERCRIVLTSPPPAPACPYPSPFQPSTGDLPTPSTVCECFYRKSFASFGFASQRGRGVFFMDERDTIEDVTVAEIGWEEKNNGTHLFLTGDARPRLILPAFDDDDVTQILQYLFYGSKDGMCPPTPFTAAEIILQYIDLTLSVRHFNATPWEVTGIRNKLLVKLASFVISKLKTEQHSDCPTLTVCARTLGVYLLASFVSVSERDFLHRLFDGRLVDVRDVSAPSVAKLIAILGLWDDMYPVQLEEDLRYEQKHALINGNVATFVYSFIHSIGRPVAGLCNFVNAYLLGISTINFTHLNSVLLAATVSGKEKTAEWNRDIYDNFVQLFTDTSEVNVLAENLLGVIRTCVTDEDSSFTAVKKKILGVLTSSLEVRLPRVRVKNKRSRRHKSQTVHTTWNHEFHRLNRLRE